MTRSRIDVSRLIRIAALACTLAAGVLVYAAYAPVVETLQARIDDGRNELRSDDLAINAATALRGERARLARRYASLLAQNSQAVFVRELATTVHRHRVALVATNVSQETSTATDTTSIPFSRTHMTIDLRGTYRTLLATIADLSTGSEIVEVREPSMHREGTEIAATVPVIIYEPLRAAAPPGAREGSGR